jgi:hypothetical protein
MSMLFSGRLATALERTGRRTGSRADSNRARPGARRWCYLLAGLTLVLGPANLSAQAPLAEQWFRRGTVMLTLQAGGAAFTDFQRATVHASSADMQPSQFQRRVGARTTASFGGWAALWLSNEWGVRVGASYAPSSFAVRNDPSAQRFLDERATGSAGTPTDYAGLRVLHADASVLFRFPVKLGRLAPYGLAGGGIVRYWQAGGGEVPPEAGNRFTDGWHAPAAVVGLGTAIALQKGDLMLVFELTDHISRTPLNDVGAGEWFEVSGVRLQLEPDATRADTDGVGITNTVRLAVGLSLPIR